MSVKIFTLKGCLRLISGPEVQGFLAKQIIFDNKLECFLLSAIFVLYIFPLLVPVAVAGLEPLTSG